MAQGAMVGRARGRAQRPENRMVRAMVVKRRLRAVFVVGVPPVHRADHDHGGDGDGEGRDDPARAPEPTKHGQAR